MISDFGIAPLWIMLLANTDFTGDQEVRRTRIRWYARTVFAKVIPTTVLALTASTVSCSALQLGFPRTPVSATSPDGNYVAFVCNHPDIDPPSQSIWLGECWKGEYPPDQMAVELTLDALGTEARFRICDRQMFRPGYVFDSTNCGDFQSISLRDGSRVDK